MRYVTAGMLLKEMYAVERNEETIVYSTVTLSNNLRGGNVVMKKIDG